MGFMKFATVAASALALTLPAVTPAVAAPAKKASASYGKPTGAAKMNVNKPKTSASYQKPGGKGAGTAGRPSTKPVKKGGGNNVVAGNTVVVGRPPAGNGYYNNGSYNNRPDWDDDDDDFLEFVGKTAAITAGVSVVSAVIGSVVNDKPSGCQPVVSGGVQYQLCDGVYYQAAPQAGPTAYQVVPPPQQ
jgi:hypothetical protein